MMTFLIEMLMHLAQATDTCLLALAAYKGGALATFDRKLSTATVTRGAEALHIIA